MILPKIREVKEALTSFFTAPYTTKFPVEGHTPEPEFRGLPKYFPEYCVGCGACEQVCPTRAITLTDDKEAAVRKLEVNYASCIHCGQCQEHCITGKGIQLSNEYNISVMDLQSPELLEDVEKELVICEACGEIIAPRDQLLWVKQRLGAKAYAHPNFLLNTQSEFVEIVPSKPKEQLRREDQIKQLCPKCRYKVVVKDEFYGF